MPVLCVLFSLLGASSNALGTVFQRKAALNVPATRNLQPRLIADLARQPVWVAGVCAVAAAAALQALALATGPLALAQPVFVLELPLALVIGSRVLRRRIPTAGWWAIGSIVLGLAVVLVSASPHGGRAQAPMARWVPTVVLCLGVVAALVAAARGRPPGAGRAACLGAASAVANALTAAMMKSAADTFSAHGVVAFLTVWQTYGFALCGVLAVFLLENALLAGPLAASQPALTLGDALIGLTLGVTLYEEEIRLGWWLLPAAVGFALIAVSTFRLARAVPRIHVIPS
ncbi:DMT family transporter [Kitasatospora sp. NPDC056783]|uniref:DMT family transporter n=1 Tax=Kitasatospora sp. NPDC056783 TaxID=3345943 RepID=UPI0036C4D40D